MPFEFVQQSSGGYDGNGSVTLPNPTTVGNRLILVITSNGTPPTPAGFTKDSSAAVAGVLFYSKPTVDGETSWTANNGTATTGLEYDLFEVSGIDPDAPVDVLPSGVGTGGSTGTTPRSTTYDGLIIGTHRAMFTAGGSTEIPTFGAHTTGEELSEHGHIVNPGATSQTLAMTTCRRFVQSLGTWECDCDATAGASQAGHILVYSAEGAKREPTVSHFWSMPAELAGLSAANLNLGTTGSRYFETVTGSGAVMLAGGGLQITGSASIENVRGITTGLSGLTTSPGHVVNLKFRPDSLPGDLGIALLADGGGQSVVLRYVAASQKLGLKIGTTGTEVLSDATVTAGQDYSVDICVRGTATTRTANWRVDYGSGPVEQTQATVSGAAQNLGSITPWLGWNVAATGQVTYWHAVYSVWAAHYPLTDRWVFPFLKPDTAGTITARTGTTADLRRFTANGTIAGSFNSADIIAALRDWPPVFGASADGAAIVTANTGTYSIPMETYDAAANGGSIRAVQVLAALWAASATACTHQMNGHDGSASTTLLAMADHNADTGSTPPWVAKLWRPTGGWTQAKMDAATIDLLSDDATPDPGWHCLGMIAAVRLADVASIIGDVAEAAIDPDTSGTIKVTAAAPVDQAVTLNWSKGGTPGSAPVAAGTTHTEELDAADATQVDYVEVVSANEAPDRE